MFLFAGNAPFRQQEVVVWRRLLLLHDVHDSEDADQSDHLRDSVRPYFIILLNTVYRLTVTPNTTTATLIAAGF